MQKSDLKRTGLEKRNTVEKRRIITIFHTLSSKIPLFHMVMQGIASLSHIT